jgi:hypothetical protein
VVVCPEGNEFVLAELGWWYIGSQKAARDKDPVVDQQGREEVVFGRCVAGGTLAAQVTVTADLRGCSVATAARSRPHANG